jgi:malate dehydrogenase
MSKKRVKIAITGAAGQIGYALVFRVASGQMLGPDTEIELQLLELEPALGSLHGVAMELDDCAFPLLKKITCTSDVNEAMSDVNWAMLVGAVPRKDGMERSDLLRINGKIFTSQGKAINDKAAQDVRVLVVGNPCNTNCLIAMSNAPDVPKDRFFAMTALDELRSRTQLAKKAGVDVTAITEMTIWGNHSSTQYPDFYHAKINGKPATDVITDIEWLKTDFISTVQKRGAEVIKVRGASSAASAANAAISTIHHLSHDTVRGESFSVGRCSEGEYDVDKGLIFSVPCRTEGGRLKVVTGLVQNDFGKEKIEKTLEELRSERDAVKELGLIG